MKTTRILTAAVLVALSFGAAADDDDWHGKHRHGKSGYKQQYWDGNCRVEIKQKKGEYKEKRKCKGGPPHVAYAPQPQVVYAPQPQVVHAPPQVVYAPQPVYVPAPVAVEPGVVIQGTVRMK